MKIVDANVLLHSLDTRALNHEPARTWIEAALFADEPVAFTWVVLLAFLRLSTHPAAFPDPLPIDAAVGVLETWLSRPNALLLHPGPEHLGIVERVLRPVGTAGNLVNDAHLAALAIEHGAELVSFDRDFGRFPGLRWRVPGEARARRNPG